MQAEQWEQLKNEIHSQCVAYDYIDASDNTLSEFIVNLVQVGKTPADVNDELVSLVGSDFDSNVIQWLFTRKQELEGPPQQQHEEPVKQQQLQESAEDQGSHKPLRSDRMETDRPKSRIFSQALGGVLNNNNRPERSSDRYTAPRRGNRSRSRSRSPERHTTRPERRRDQREIRRGDRRDDRQSGDVFSRIGNASRDDERPSVFDRLGGSRPVIVHEQQIDSKKEERCKYWPTCKNGDDCPYVHPTTVCPDFPKCPKKAIECLYIHPETNAVKPMLQQPVSKLPFPCKYFPYCNNPACPYMHPMIAQQRPFFMQSKPAFGTVGQRVQIPCKNGDACTRPDCHFLHPKDPNPQADIVCKFDGACTRPNCFYKHTKENNTQNKVLINKAERPFSVSDDQVEERIPLGQSADLISQQQQQQEQRQQQTQAMDMDHDVVMDAA